MKRCELCRLKAAIYCESDKASLCWTCDARVHSANFLVARHSRYLICGVCRSPTPWAATGAVLSPTVAVCEKCVHGKRGAAGAEVEERNEVVEENQIAPPSESSSYSGEAVFSRKRRLELENVSNFTSDDADQYRSSYKLNVRTPLPAAAACVRQEDETEESYLAKEASPARKVQKTTSFKMGEIGIPGSGILESLRRFHREEMGSGLQMAESCSLSEDGPNAVDLSSCDSS